MKKKVTLCVICRAKTDGSKCCDDCKKRARSESKEVRKKVEEAMKNE